MTRIPTHDRSPEQMINHWISYRLVTLGIARRLLVVEKRRRVSTPESLDWHPDALEQPVTSLPATETGQCNPVDLRTLITRTPSWITTSHAHIHGINFNVSDR